MDTVPEGAEEIVAALRSAGLIGGGDRPTARPLTGGVSSDIWKIELAGRTVCVKRALAKLKVAADWRAPVGRNAHEVAWFETVGRIVPGAVPEILAHDPSAGLFVMEYLDPASHRLWKSMLLAGEADPAIAGAVAAALVAIHAGTAGDADVAARFATDATFHAIRLEPYLEATARAHPDRADALLDLVRVTAGTRRALVHGDVSPKNILIGPRGPVFLDAECAWYGDPAFDAAFCLNHLLLKCLWRPDAASACLACFRRFGDTYLAGVDWEPRAELEGRIARLLPGLFLARVDGKSPVEYVTADAQKDRVRRVARALLDEPVETLGAVCGAWERELKGTA